MVWKLVGLRLRATGDLESIDSKKKKQNNILSFKIWIKIATKSNTTWGVFWLLSLLFE